MTASRFIGSVIFFATAIVGGIALIQNAATWGALALLVMTWLIAASIVLGIAGTVVWAQETTLFGHG